MFLLAWTGGFVDAVGFLMLFGVFVAHISGNTVAFGAYAGRWDWDLALRRLTPIFAFVAGNVVGTALNQEAVRHGARSRSAIVLGLEIALLIPALIWSTTIEQDGSIPEYPAWQFHMIAGLLALAMGVQNAALTRIHGLGIHTTYVTGLLHTSAEALVRAVNAWRDRAAGRPGDDSDAGGTDGSRVALRDALITVAIYAAYVLGAIGGGVATGRWAAQALVLPLIGLMIVIAADLVRPLQPPATDQSRRT
ncbi:MAG: YoaK family protein [Dehalococcoidia bacterium]